MDRIKRPARLLGLVCLLPLAVTGCRTMVPTKPAAAPGAAPTQDNAARPPAPKENPGSIVKTDFHRKVTADQTFNVHIELGKQLMQDQQFESALAEFKKALEACTPHASGMRTGAHRTEQQALAQRKIGGALLRLGKFGEAEERFKLAAKLTPNDPRIWNDMGYSYYLESRWADAERCLRRAAKLDPDSPLVNTNLGLAVAADGRAADALALLSHSSGKAVGHANLAYSLAAQKRDVEARDEYRKALALQPQLTRAQQALARLANPSTSEPLTKAPSIEATRAPGFAPAPLNAVAMPAAPAQAAPIYQASETRAPASSASVAPVSSAANATPAVPGTPQRTTDTSPTDRALRPASHGSLSVPVTPVAPAVTKSVSIPLPTRAPARRSPPVQMSAPVAVPPAASNSAPVTVPSARMPAVAPSVSNGTRAPLGTTSVTQYTAASMETDHAVRPVSYSSADTVPTQVAPAVSQPKPLAVAARDISTPSDAPALPTAAVPPPVPARLEVSEASAIPKPVPPSTKPGTAPKAAKQTTIPMPVPFPRHTAPPTAARVLNPMSAPAADTAIRPVASSN